MSLEMFSFPFFSRLGHGDLIEEEGKSTPFRVELLHIQKYEIIIFLEIFMIACSKGRPRGCFIVTV
jgi:hypothetical protein